MSSYLEAIAALGGGSLHPGGFSHTLETMKRLTISPDDVVLDVGCGTGRTACYLARRFGAHVFALDKSEEMLAKARFRALQEGAEVHFVHGDALNMPFRDEVADLIVMESVLIFLPVRDVLKECYRVLKRNGVLVDVEMLASESLHPGAREKLKAFCGLPQIPTLGEWVNFFNEAGFSQVFMKQKRFPGVLEKFKEALYLDSCRVVSKELMTVNNLKILGKYMGLILRNRRSLGFGTFIVKKQPA
ncbi:MAG: methyltransferase domain-containing protein [Pelotomaculum sp.]|uniref:SAM-dependent methyltransferases n=1 Tax=Pelotomaculum thermopropionicum (strain DSM 13744 / JCM 10971 / SI) TaxID=370438 RepID=A5D299_PELTS|nr:methyltransferase domain-containing protein [Pelotomaculum sp.]BAF59642.1 SAM-dependent methyltransferases [Pelotomaculum thermopropionicum SI]